MAKKTIKRRPRKQQEVASECFFCKENKNPSFLEHEILTRFVSERGKIFARSRTGLCSKHQRKLTIAVKRARYIGFLPFVVRPE
jgi:small subunit ribosomal protein S18